MISFAQMLLDVLQFFGGKIVHTINGEIAK
jgi:hypothetical protein